MRNRSLLPSLLVAFAAAAALGGCKSSGAKDDPHAEPRGASAMPAPPSVPKPHGDHDAQHGGVVMMTADLHVETVLGSDGKYRVYWSDAARDPLAASKLEKVTLTIVRPGEAPEEVTLAKDASDKLWEGQGKPLAEPAKADITLTYNGPGQAPTPQKIVFPEAHAGPAAGHAASGEHAHPAPHGGQVATTKGGHIELLATPDGSFKLWLLDANLANRPAAGASATVKVAVSGYADVPLSVVGDHLEGKGAEIQAEHATAAVTVKVEGEAETARFTLHFEKAGHQH